MDAPRTPSLILGTVGVAFAIAAALVPQVEPHSLQPAPVEPSSTASQTLYSVVGPQCTPTAGKKVADAWQACTDDGEKVCAKYDPPLSDQCAAESQRSGGLKVDYTYFGEADCRSWNRKRKVERVVVHNGGSAKVNNNTWRCRPAASHYTVQRDGRIFQHVGEERAAAHANTENDDTIGIELETMVAYGGRCNSSGSHSGIAKSRGLAKEDVTAEMCGPTRVQYESLRKLIADIKTRHPIKEDGGVFGHCEVKATDHGDPRAFDWSELGVPMRKAVNVCTWDEVMALKAKATVIVPVSTSVRMTFDHGSRHGLEKGDHGYLEDEHEKIVGWFEIESVTSDTATATLPVDLGQVFDRVNATLIATPGRSPSAPLGSAAKTFRKRGGSSGGASASSSGLGSCATGYEYWKKGEIFSWTMKADATIDLVVVNNAGSDHRICDDSTGLVYVDAVDGAFLTDAKGTKVKLTALKVGRTVTTFKVTEGSIDAKALGQSRHVVLRAKKR